MINSNIKQFSLYLGWVLPIDKKWFPELHIKISQKRPNLPQAQSTKLAQLLKTIVYKI